MKKMMRIAAALAALALLAVLAGCKGKEKSNMSVEIAGRWVCSVRHEHPEGLEYMGSIYYETSEDISYDFRTDGTYEYEWSAVQAAAVYRDGTYIVNKKKGKIELMQTWGDEVDNYTLEIKGDMLVNEKGLVFTKYQ